MYSLVNNAMVIFGRLQKSYYIIRNYDKTFIQVQQL